MHYKNSHFMRLDKEILFKILSYIDAPEVGHMLMINHSLLIKLKSPYFEPLWTIHSFHEILSKAGLTAMRNWNLLRIDRDLKEMN